ncbi:MAG TPA: AMP-binding protein, partial [Nocardioides sp.]|nr:AMP-binding protein [Nocardioides sp.]
MAVEHDLADLVAEAAAERPEALAIVESGGRRLSWSGLEDEVGRIATGLGMAGIVAGQRVLLAVGNRLEFVTTYLGVLRAQMVAVPVNPRATVDELARMIADSGSRLVVADPSTVAAVREAVALVRGAVEGANDLLDDDLVARAAAGLLVVVIDAEPREDELSFDRLRANHAEQVLPLPDPEKLATLLYTSGTSGR